MSTYSADVLATSGLLYYWQFKEPSGTTATDSLGSNTGTYQGTVTLGQTGLVGAGGDTAVLLNGSTGYVSTATSIVNPQGPFTLECWFKTTSTAGGLIQFANTATGAAANNDRQLYVGADGKVYFGIFGGSQIIIGSTSAYNDGSWHHAVAVLASSNNMTLYVDGSSVASNANTTAPDSYTGFWRVGEGIGGGGWTQFTSAANFLLGTMGHAAIYNAALSAATVLDHYQAGTLTGSYAPPRSLSKPPLELHAEVTLADGTHYRWDSGAKAGDRPQGITFRTKTGDGFADASVTLARRIDQDYVDLNLLDDVAFAGGDGSVAYEGRVSGLPRSMGDAHSVAVQCAGWMSHARDRKFTEVYVDRDTGAWGDMALLQKTAWAGVRDIQTLSWSNDGAGLTAAAPNQSITSAVTEAWYEAPTGVTIAYVQYIGADTSLPAGWEAPTLRIASDTIATAQEVYGATFDSTLRTVTATTTRRYAYWSYRSSGVAVTPAVGTLRRIAPLAVYGNHGVTQRAIDSTTPDGLYASDVITNIVQRFCPRLNTSGIQATTYAIPHLTFKDPTDPYDAFLDVNKHHLWFLGVWENKTLTFRPYDLSDYNWEVRLSDPGVTLDLQGDSADDLANGICVNYTDVGTGRAARITPSDDTTLADTSVGNPANTRGLTKWTELTLSSPTTAEAATQVARIALAEHNLPKAPGTITVTGHIKDRAGHWQQGWKVRAGDTVAITDHPNDRPRLVTETTWNDDSKTLTISVEGPAHRLDALFDRITTSMTAANLG